MKTASRLRLMGVIAGGLLLTGVAGTAFAAEPYGSDDIDVDVQIAPLTEPGVLAMSVAGTSSSLTETGSTATVRQFTGTMPTVTVTDTRDADEIPAGVGWYVLGSSTDFMGDAGQPVIGAEHFGWTPHLIDGGESGLVAEGEQVDTVLDPGPDNVGLVGQELLALAIDSGEARTDGSWTANADLFLKTPADVAAGSYSSVLTLSLFE
ncbi:hypothetical protein HQQ80_15890 [Microbacteriaceae bacterium VKM Ac-2855]|nr:hypothetical protein [Microbacteriaceae bacterium VKM Ac-2855]